MHPVAKSWDERPLLLFWEMTRACPLACAHCRACAQPTGLPGELTTEEGKRFLDDAAGFGSPSPILVMTGGDPLTRPDFFELLTHARDKKIKIALAPAVSKALSKETMVRLREGGVNAISISLDGACAATHDGIRNVPGHFDATIAKLAELVEHGFMVQVNTTVMRRNVEELAEIAALLHRLGVHVWEVFFLVQVGRGLVVEEVSPAQAEDVSHFLFDAACYGFIVRTVEAPFFRRVVTWRVDAEEGSDPAAQFHLGPLYERLSTTLTTRLGAKTTRPKATSAGTRDGNGILFVAHDGEVCPAGFLPLPLGNVKTRNVVDLYRNHPLLVDVRDAKFHGKCGACDYRALCGGSRSRAFAHSSDPLGEDPACAYVPAGYVASATTTTTTKATAAADAT
jgi:AdoMet-dependent heme synthase